MFRRFKKAWLKQDWPAFIIEFFIVILGIVIAYQINVYRQSVEQEKYVTDLKRALAKENKQNLEVLETVRYQTLRNPDNIERFLTLVKGEANTDSLNRYSSSILNVQYMNINDSFLNYFLENIDKTKQDEIIDNLIKLQNLYLDLHFILEGTIIPYRIKLISEDLISSVDLNNFEFTTDNRLNTQSVVNKLYLLKAMEEEHRRILNLTYDQVLLIDSILLADKAIQIPDSTSD